MARAELFLLKWDQIFAGSHQGVVIPALQNILYKVLNNT